MKREVLRNLDGSTDFNEYDHNVKASDTMREYRHGKLTRVWVLDPPDQKLRGETLIFSERPVTTYTHSLEHPSPLPEPPEEQTKQA